MTYTKGKAYRATVPCQDYDETLDCRCALERSQEHNLWLREGAGVVALPHACDEWVIGRPDDVRALIADLQDLL